MALTKIRRHRVPNDGTVIRTTASLNSIMRAVSRYDDDMEWPKFCNETSVPVYVRMELYKAQETRQRPDGMIYGPVVRVGAMDSPEVPMFGHHHAAGLFNDYNLDGHDTTDKWLYRPLDDDANSHGEDVSVYRCDLCNNDLYRDELGLRHDRSACIFRGGLVCRDCEVTGLVFDRETREQIVRCRKLADHLGPDCRKRFENHLEQLGLGFSFRWPAQTRLFREDTWSFFWRTVCFTDAGKKEGMHGGLIQHGPHPTLNDDGSFTFTTWDYGLKKEREATAEEVAGVHWGIHT